METGGENKLNSVTNKPRKIRAHNLNKVLNLAAIFKKN
jgi:hypothetical protein